MTARHSLGSARQGAAWLAAALLFACVALARAQPLVVLGDPRVDALRACLTPAPTELPALAYPADELLLKRGGTVRVRMTFTKPGASPSAELFYNDAGAVFGETVLDRVKQFRLPCLSPGDSPVVLTQELYFDPRDGRPVFWNAPRAAALTQAPNRCTKLSGPDVVYPRDAIDPMSTGTSLPRRRQSGVLIGTFEVSAEGKPTHVDVVPPKESPALVAAVEDVMEKTLLRCDRYPARVRQEFEFRIEGEKRFGLKDMSLRNFAGLVKDLDKQAVRFDFDTMHCPFDVDVKLYQPYFSNSVGEVGEIDPGRADFLEWLSSVTLQLPKEAAGKLLGATTRISIPCGTLDLRS